MTPAQVLADVEAKFIVHDEIGLPIMSIGDDGAEFDTGARNMGRAPTGESYVTVMSGGIRPEGNPVPVLFGDEDRAWRWWYYAVLDYAETIAPEADWQKLHLYWRDRPEFSFAEYITVDGAQRLQRGEPIFNQRLGTVFSRLLISKLRPDGTEES